MCIKKLIDSYRQRAKEREDICEAILLRVNDSIRAANSIFLSPTTYIDPIEEYKWRSENLSVLIESEPSAISHLRKTSKYTQLFQKQADLHNMSTALGNRIIRHNEKVAEQKISQAYQIIGAVEGRRLDRQQMSCIVKDAHSHLVIAGAGTGKTTTVVSKIKYLLKTNKYSPDEILVLSFTNASATEMCQRINKETGYNIAASTFHKLGLNIISKVDGIMPKITQINLRKFVKEQLAINMQKPDYLRLLLSYIVFNPTYSSSEFDFDSLEKYNEHLKLNPPTTLNGEVVKSYGEMDIANFLASNGIKYIYENPYFVDTRTEEYGQYKPDFYLPDYDTYIEYFAINRDGQVPSYFSGQKGMSPTETYTSSMEWKRKLHAENNTRLIEVFAYEKLEDTLTDCLAERLTNASIPLSPVNSEELLNTLKSKESSLLDGVIELFETLINLIKSNAYSIDTVRNLNKSRSNNPANNKILTLLEPIFNAYCRYLTENDEIDFNDMINLATSYVTSGKYQNPYKYVIVDEYQDISKSRYMLLYALRQHNNYDLFCVGDDWQSIYRFAGSDIGYILNFSNYWGSTEISKIETTYRFSKELINVSGKFVMKNPRQIKKAIQGKTESIGFPVGEIHGYTEKYAIEFLSNKLADVPKDNSVYFIGRYSFDAKILEESGLFTYQYNNVTGFVDVKSKERPDLKITFMTAHKSKGLQADYVFILNNKSSRMGFPSKIQDAKILELLLDNCDSFPDAEERRLFYVALTRAKKKAYLVTVENQESSFVKDLKTWFGEQIKKEQFQCPLCGGNLLKKTGPYGEFFGCSNYSKLGCKYIRKIKK